MREFLVGTAAQRVVAEGVMSNVLRDVTAQGGQLTTDFIDALIKVQGKGDSDVRNGKNCVWHMHMDTRPCLRRGSEN
jgi:hypothetical protein